MRIPRQALACLGIALCTYVYAGEVDPAVPQDLAVQVASAHAQEAWPGCQYLSTVPYHALDGTITAWAVQFTKPGSAIKAEAEIQPLMASRLAMRQALARTAEAQSTPTRIDMQDPFAFAQQKHGILPLPPSLDFAIPSEAMNNARKLQESRSLAYETAAEQQRRTQEAELAALRAANLADDMGTVVISAREDLYPVLEAHSGPAAHLKFAGRLAEAARLSSTAMASEKLVERVYYPGQMTYWLEPATSVAMSAKAAPGQWFNAEDASWVDGEARRSMLGAVTLKPAFDKEVGVPPQQVWATLREAKNRGVSPPDFFTKADAENSIPGVPFYFQSQYGRNSCGPTTFATILGYFDTQGWGTLVDNGISLHDGPGEDGHLVFYCMRDTGYDPDLGTWPDWDPIESGIRKVCEEPDYANFVNAHVNEETDVSYGNDIVDYIDKGRPVAYCWYIDNADATTGHWSTIVGYKKTGSSRYVTLHNNWESHYPDGLTLNTSNVYDANEWCEKIRIDEEPFDTLWSECWEVCTLDDHSCGGAWGSFASIDGVPQPAVGWMTTDLRGHSRPYDPYPEYGGLSHSKKITPPSHEQGDPYPPNMESYLVYGPFSTMGRTWGEVSAMMALEMDDRDDIIRMVASVDGQNFFGPTFRDPFAGIPLIDESWFNGRLDLSNVPELGNVLNQENVWIGFHFRSDGDANSSKRGPFVDNINIILRPRLGTTAVPGNLQASQGVSFEHITLSCDPVPGATHYQFLRYKGESRSYVPITGWIQATATQDAESLLGFRYNYKVRAANNPSGTDASDLSAEAEGWRGTRPPYNANATQGNYTDKIVLTFWDNDHSHFLIERSLAGLDGPWENIKTAQRSSLLVDADQPSLFQFTDTSPVAGRNYYYRVSGTLGPAHSSYTDPLLGYLKLPNVEVTATGTTIGVDLAWDTEPGRFYAVYHDNNPSGVPTRIRDWAPGGSYSHALTGSTGVYHYYYVRQALDATGKAQSDYGNYAEGFKVNGTPAPRASDGEFPTLVRIEWDPVPGAGYYQLLGRSLPNGANQVLLNWSPTSSYNDTMAPPGMMRYYTLVAASSNTGFAKGAPSTLETGWRGLGMVQNIQATDGTRSDGVWITWDSVTGAGAYRVARSTSPSGIGVVVGDWRSANNFFDVTAETNTIYYYKIQPAATLQGDRPGNYGNYDAGHRGLTPPASLAASDGSLATGVHLTWDAFPGNVLYRISRSASETGSYLPLSSWSRAASYDDNTALPGTVYWYAVEAALDSSGSGGTGPGTPDSGWRRLHTPDQVDASDGEPAVVTLKWDESPYADYYDLYYAATPTGTKTLALGNITTNQTTYTPPAPGTTYYFFVKALITPGTPPLLESDFSPPDAGSYTAPPVSHPPNCANAYGVVSYIDGLQVQQAEVADDWVCPNSSPIRTIQWWGNYRNYNNGSDTEVRAPGDGAQGFLLRMYSVGGGRAPAPGTLLKETRIDNFSETWSCAVPHHDDPRLFEHQFVYRATLPEAWNQVASTQYYIAILALMPAERPANPWCWMSANTSTHEPAYYRDGVVATQLFYPVGHPNAGQNLSMAFVMDTNADPTSTPTPSPTPSATPTPSLTPTPPLPPGGKWQQPADIISGRAIPSSTNGATESLAADDWQCLDGLPILRVRWCGSYAGYATADPALLPPPADVPAQFLLSWYTRVGEQVPMPGTLIGQETVTDFHETAVGTVNSPTGPQTFEFQHLYQYEATLATPWAQALGTKYFLSIQAVFPATPAHGWGWFTADTEYGAPTHLKPTIADPWTPLYHEQWHPMWPGGVDLAFELLTQQPTPTPSPTPSLTPTPSQTPTASPTPTPTATPTPPNLRVDHQPNLADGVANPSWSVPSPRRAATPARVADDWQSPDDRPLDRVRWWGAYANWHESSPAPVDPPANRPAQYHLAWSRLAAGPPHQPGELLTALDTAAVTETWIAAVPNWSAPGTFIHVYQYDVTLPGPWYAAAGQTCFLEVQAVYSVAPAQNEWGWFAATEQAGHAAVQMPQGASWTELAWPAGHRLAGSPMDMAFQLWAVESLPTPTPSPTPPILPSDTPTPTPTPFGWTGGIQLPNTIDGIDTLSGTEPEATINNAVADDVLFDHDVTIGTLYWWGSYPGWQSGTSSPTKSPASLEGLIGNLDWPHERPVAFRLTLYEPAATGMGEPGTLLSQQSLPNWTEEWVAAVPRFGVSGSWEHEYFYTASLPQPLALEAGVRYFLEIQALYSTPDLNYQWGWLASSQHFNSSAFARTAALPWGPMEWPAGHRLQGQPMDMAFELREGLVPTPTPTPSPTATPPVTPTPTPNDWFSLGVAATNGIVGISPDQPGYAPGTSVVLNARGDDGYAFSSWSGDIPAGQATQNPLVLQMDRHRTIAASFDLVPYTLAATTDHGTITITPDQSHYDFGTVVTVEVHLPPGYFFERWEMPSSDLGEAELAQNPLQIEITESVTMRAVVTTHLQTWWLY